MKVVCTQTAHDTKSFPPYVKFPSVCLLYEHADNNY